MKERDWQKSTRESQISYVCVPKNALLVVGLLFSLVALKGHGWGDVHALPFLRNYCAVTWVGGADGFNPDKLKLGIGMVEFYFIFLVKLAWLD